MKTPWNSQMNWEIYKLITRFEVEVSGSYRRKKWHGLFESFLKNNDARGLISIMSPRAYINNEHKGLFQ